MLEWVENNFEHIIKSYFYENSLCVCCKNIFCITTQEGWPIILWYLWIRLSNFACFILKQLYQLISFFTYYAHVKFCCAQCLDHGWKHIDAYYLKELDLTILASLDHTQFLKQIILSCELVRLKGDKEARNYKDALELSYLK